LPSEAKTTPSFNASIALGLDVATDKTGKKLINNIQISNIL